MVMPISFKASLGELCIHTQRTELIEDIMIYWDSVIPYYQPVRAGLLGNLLPPLVLSDLLNVKSLIRVYC